MKVTGFTVRLPKNDAEMLKLVAAVDGESVASLLHRLALQHVEARLADEAFRERARVELKLHHQMLATVARRVKP